MAASGDADGERHAGGERGSLPVRPGDEPAIRARRRPAGAPATVRRYRASDRPRCIELFDSLVPEYFLPNEREPYVEFLAALPGPYFVVECRSRLAGCGGYAIDERGAAHLCWGMIRQDLHGQGVGRLLAKARLEAIRSEGVVSRVVMTTSPVVEGFYRKLGFHVTGIRRDGLGPGLDAIDMQLDLDGEIFRPDAAAARR